MDSEFEQMLAQARGARQGGEHTVPDKCAS